MWFRLLKQTGVGVFSFFSYFNALGEYPPSSAITGVAWDWSTADRQAAGSDLWPVTWASDDRTYTSFGDGGGFAGNISGARVSLGVSRLVGPANAMVGQDIWGRPPYADYRASFAGKPTGMLAIGSRLYMWVNFRRSGDGGTPGNAVLTWSDNNGASWKKASWQWTKSRFADPTFLNFGKAYANARDGFVYSYAPDTYGGDPNKRHTKRSRIYMFRVPKDQMTNRSAYQFFTGKTATGVPTWSSNIADSKAVFENTNKISWVMSVTWFPGLNRYFLFNNNASVIGDRTPSSLAIYDAPQPWGPWTKVVEYRDWVGSNNTIFSYYPIPKSITSNGKEFTVVFSGHDKYDSWNTVRGKWLTP